MVCKCCDSIVPRHRVVLQAERPQTTPPLPKFGQLRRHAFAIPWSEDDKDYVIDAWPVAFRMLSESVRSLNAIRAVPRKRREAAWNASPARKWFGTYRRAHLDIARRYARRAHRKMLRGWVIFFRLDLPDAGSASRGARAIRLKNSFFRPGELWDCDTAPPSNVSYTSTLRNADTIVHELIHTVGKTLGTPNERYGRDALRLPAHKAIRNAANHAGFAMEVYVDAAFAAKPLRWRTCLRTVYLNANTPVEFTTREPSFI